MWRDVMLLSYVGGNSELWGMLGLWDRYFGPWGSPTLKRRRRLSTETFLQRFNGDVYILFREILCVKISRVLETNISKLAKTVPSSIVSLYDNKSISYFKITLKMFNEFEVLRLKRNI